MSPLLFDSHAHYFDRRFEALDGGVDAFLESEIFSNRVGYIVNVGTNPKNSRKAIEMALRHPGMYATVGIHPEDAQLSELSAETAIREIESLVSDPELRRASKIVALGEIGLDYHEWADGNFRPDKAFQKHFFDLQMELADRYGLPVIIHDREAHGDCFETVLRYPSVKGVFHSFSGSVDLARELVRRGWYISFSGVVTFKNAPRVKEVAASVPLDRILVETDAPYLAPHPFRGTMNDSAKMWYTAETLAELHGISVDEMITVTAENAARLYGITL